MPLIKLQLTNGADRGLAEPLLKSISRMLAEETGKPEAYVMATLEQADTLFAGISGPAAFADIRGIGGFDRKVNAGVTKALCALLQEQLGIPPDRVYATFTDIPAENWGWNSRTFA
jgi:phenylpyruvate tautomerase